MSPSSHRVMTTTIVALAAAAATIVAPVQGFTTSSGLSKLSKSVSKQSSLSMMMDPAAIGNFYHDEPYLAAFLTCSIKGSLADGIAQQKQQPQHDKQFDVSRNLAFILYGGLYQGMGQSFLFSHVYPHLFGTDHTLATVASEVLTDLFVVGPFFCLPTAYTIKASLASSSSSSDMMDLRTNIGTGVTNYLADIRGEDKLLWKYWSLWIPVQSMTFGVIPEHLRVPFVAMVSFFWVMLLSSVSSSSTTAVPMEETMGEEATGFIPPSILSAWPEKQWVSS